MPHFTLKCTPDGLEVSILIALDTAEMAKRLAAGSPVPRPVRVRGLLDTGSDISCTVPRVVSQLGLLLLRQDVTQTAAGPLRVNLYEASLSVLMPGAAPVTFLTTLEQLTMMELPSLTSGIEAVVGLDVLYRLWLFLDGPRREFTLGD
jgi:hypothetical protein